MTTSGETPAAEPFGERQFYDFLNGASNHELKLLTGAVILAYPDIAFSPALLRRALADGQGDHEAWKIETSIPKNYCIHSLEPIGAVVKTAIRGEQGALVAAFEAEPDHREVRLACIGTLLGWSLEYPDMSVQHVFGTTASRTHVRAPEMRYRSYTALLTGNDGGTVKSMFTSLEGKGYPNYANMYTQLVRMQELGIIDLRTTDQNPEIAINHDSYQTLFHALEEDTLPAAQAAYAAIEQFGQSETTSVNEVVDTALAIDPTINPVALRTMLIDRVNKKVYSDPEHVQCNPQRTTVTFAPAAKKPITELHERLEATRAGDYTGSQTAGKILEDPQAFRTLVGKARSFSHLVKGKESGRKLLETQLVHLVTTQGQSAIELRDALKAQYGREIAERSLRDVLRDLVNSGKIRQDAVIKKPYPKRSTAVFKPLDS